MNIYMDYLILQAGTAEDKKKKRGSKYSGVLH